MTLGDWIFWGIVLTLVAPFLAAWVRDSVVEFGHAGLEFLGRPFWSMRCGLAQLRETLRELTAEGISGLRYASDDSLRDTTDRSTSWPGWLLIGPVVYLGAFVALVFTVGILSEERFAELLGSTEGTQVFGRIGLSLHSALAVTVVALGLVFGLIILDLLKATPFRRPWSNLDRDRQRTVLHICIAGLVLVAIGVFAEFVWGELQTNRYTGDSKVVAFFDRAFPIVFWTFLAAALVGGIALTGWALAVSLGAFWLLLLLVISTIAAIVGEIAGAVVGMLDMFHKLLTAFWDIFAHVGATGWRLLRKIPGLRSWLPAIPPFRPRPVVGATFPDFAAPPGRAPAEVPPLPADEEALKKYVEDATAAASARGTTEITGIQAETGVEVERTKAQAGRVLAKADAQLQSYDAAERVNTARIRMEMMAAEEGARQRTDGADEAANQPAGAPPTQTGSGAPGEASTEPTKENGTADD